VILITGFFQIICEESYGEEEWGERKWGNYLVGSYVFWLGPHQHISSALVCIEGVG
jgi:hypothetical protein